MYMTLWYHILIALLIIMFYPAHTPTNTTCNAPMPIPQQLLDLADKNTEVYKMYVELASGSIKSSKLIKLTPEAHRI